MPSLSTACWALHVSAEFIAHGREHLVGVVGLTARTEALVERGGEHVRRDDLVDGRLDRKDSWPFASERWTCLLCKTCMIGTRRHSHRLPHVRYLRFGGGDDALRGEAKLGLQRFQGRRRPKGLHANALSGPANIPRPPQS
jgi:hypothetical protein